MNQAKVQGNSRVSDAERVELCHALDLAELVRGDTGKPLRPASGHLVGFAPWHGEATPSLHIYPPGVGQQGGRGWTWKHFGTGQGGDAIAYLIESRGLGYVEALREAERMTGRKVLQTSGAVADFAPLVGSTKQETRTDVLVSLEAQTEAIGLFAALVAANVPDTWEKAEDYLATRGISMDAITEACRGESWFMPGTAAREIADQARDNGTAPQLIDAGIMKPAEDGKPERLAWWADVVFLPCLDLAGERVDYLTARQLGPEAKPKYLNQGTPKGGRRVPFGLPSLRAAADAGDAVHLVEGPITALGGITLGLHCVAMLGRPGFADYERAAHVSQIGMIAPMLQDMARCRRVLVVPDNDSTEEKRKPGMDNAGELVRWLRLQGITAEVATMEKLGYGTFKDLADAAKGTK
jgi:DNA primase